MNTNENIEPRARRRPHGKRRWWLKIPLIIGVMIFAKSAVVMLLWNALIPDLFHGPVVNYLQAMGLVVLVKLLVGFGFGGGGRFGRHGFGGHGMHGPWSRWENMSPEQREKLREKLEKRFGADKTP